MILNIDRSWTRLVALRRERRRRRTPGAIVGRQWAVVVASVVVPAVLAFGFGHRGNHMARNLLVPGAGLFEEHPLAGTGFLVAAIMATISWTRWGTDWMVGAVVLASIVATGFAGSPIHAEEFQAVQRAAHEFPAVVLVMSALAWLSSVVASAPLVRHRRARRAARLRGLVDVAQLPVVDRCRTVSIAALGGTPSCGWEPLLAAINRPDVSRRARRIGVAARGRFRGDALRADNAAIRAALALSGSLDEVRVDTLIGEAGSSVAGAPASEPGWVRPLDATLVVIALSRLGHRLAVGRWEAMLNGPLGLRRSHRPAWYWTPLGIAAGSAPAWEHAASTALGRWMGWIGDADWHVLRRRVLGAAARGTSDVDDARLVAAGRLWLCFVDDVEAARIVHRPTMSGDPLACALDDLAAALAMERAPDRV